MLGVLAFIIRDPRAAWRAMFNASQNRLYDVNCLECREREQSKRLNKWLEDNRKRRVA